MSDKPEAEFNLTPPYFDGERLVLPHVMMWVAATNGPFPWAIRDTDGGVEYCATKEIAKAKLRRYAEEG